jgi:hypothetical protein
MYRKTVSENASKRFANEQWQKWVTAQWSYFEGNVV